MKEPEGPVEGFSPWNFPATQLVRKIAAALAAGCSIIAKVPEETPTSTMELVRCFADVGVPAGVANRVFSSPVIRKVSSRARCRSVGISARLPPNM